MKKTEIENFEKGKIIHLHGQFTGGEETDELEQLLAEIKDEGKDSVIVDFEDVSYLSSIVIGLIVRTKADFQKKSKSVIYCNLNKTLEDVLKMTKVWSVLDIAPNIETAKTMVK